MVTPPATILYVVIGMILAKLWGQLVIVRLMLECSLGIWTDLWSQQLCEQLSTVFVVIYHTHVHIHGTITRHDPSLFIYATGVRLWGGGHCSLIETPSRWSQLLDSIVRFTTSQRHLSVKVLKNSKVYLHFLPLYNMHENYINVYRMTWGTYSVLRLGIG